MEGCSRTVLIIEWPDRRSLLQKHKYCGGNKVARLLYANALDCSTVETQLYMNHIIWYREVWLIYCHHSIQQPLWPPVPLPALRFHILCYPLWALKRYFYEIFIIFLQSFHKTFIKFWLNQFEFYTKK